MCALDLVSKPGCAQVLTKEEPGIWQKLSPNMQKIVKEQLLEGIKGEKDRSLNKKVY